MGLVSVHPESPANTHHISLSGLGRTFGVRLERGAKSIIEAPIQPSNVERGGGVKKFGDFDPQFAHIEMRDWTGGRGGEFLSDDPTMYYDGYGWSLTPGMFYQAPQWWWGEFRGPSTAASTVANSELPTTSCRVHCGPAPGITCSGIVWHLLHTLPVPSCSRAAPILCSGRRRG